MNELLFRQSRGGMLHGELLEGVNMRRSFILAAGVAALMFAGVAEAQQGAASAAPDLSPVANPVSGAVKNQLPRFSKNMVAAAEAMPADKFGFKPTPEMNSFG